MCMHSCHLLLAAHSLFLSLPHSLTHSHISLTHPLSASHPNSSLLHTLPNLHHLHHTHAFRPTYRRHDRELRLPRPDLRHLDRHRSPRILRGTLRVCVYMRKCGSICGNGSVWACAGLYVCLYECTYVCMYVCICVGMFVCYTSVTWCKTSCVHALQSLYILYLPPTYIIFCTLLSGFLFTISILGTLDLCMFCSCCYGTR